MGAVKRPILNPRPKLAHRPRRRRLRPCAAQVVLGRSIALGIDTYEFLKGHRLQRPFSQDLLRECREIEDRLVNIHDIVTGIS